MSPSRIVAAALALAALAAGGADAELVPLTGGTGSSVDADGDGWADEGERALDVDPGSTPATQGGSAAAKSLNATASLAATQVREGEGTTQDTLAFVVEAAVPLARGGAAAIASETQEGRASLAGLRSETLALAPAPARPVLAASFGVADLVVAESGATGTETLQAGAGLLSGSPSQVATVTAPAFDGGRDLVLGAAFGAGLAASEAAQTVDEIVRPTARFLYDSEPTTAAIRGEDQSGLPVTGVWVDVSGEGARRPDGTEDVALTDRDGDLYSDRAETLTGHSPTNPDSTPDDFDRDNRTALVELSSGLSRFSATPGGIGTTGGSASLGTGRSDTRFGIALAGALTVSTAESGEADLLGDHAVSICPGSASSCATDPDRDGQTTVNEILLNGDPTDPTSTGPGGPIPPDDPWPLALPVQAATTGSDVFDDLRTALQVG